MRKLAEDQQTGIPVWAVILLFVGAIGVAVFIEVILGVRV